MTEPTITNTTAGPHQQYEIRVGGIRAGLAAYADTDTQRIFYDTKVDDEFGGRGLGTKLIAAALADTRATGKRIVPMCSFVAAYVHKHGDYTGLVDPVTPQAQAVVAAQQG